MGAKKDTMFCQNILSSALNDVHLNIDKPSIKIKKQYQKAIIALSVARHEFDILNDLIEEQE